jgi:hypothetical protein
MTVNIVYDYPRRGLLVRAWRPIARFLGFLLVLAGVAASSLPLLFIVGLAYSLVAGKGLGASAGSAGGRDLELVVGVGAFVIASWLIGSRLLRGRRRPVLFLRRFGFVGATEALTFAVATAIGSTWRLVTLDDDKVAPVGATKGLRLGSCMATLLAGSAVVYGLFWAFGGGLGRTLDEVGKSAAKSAMRQGNQNPVQAVIGSIFAVMVSMIAVGVILGVLVAMAIALSTTIALFSVGSYLSVRRAERAKKLEVRSAQMVEPATRAVLRRARRVLSPRLVVVHVASGAWRLAVDHLASHCAAVVVDVSVPSENLLWEIRNLRRVGGVGWILVGDIEHVSGLAGGGSVQASTLGRELVDLLEGQDVLAYASDRRSRKRFARALRARLEMLSRPEPRATYRL